MHATLPSTAAPAGASFTGTPRIRGSSASTRLLLLNLAIIGIQFTWGVEMTYCTPYLLALGLSKSRTSLVWIAGPLSGLIMQPLVGALADKSTSKYGRRRPVMVIGSVVVGGGLVVLGWTKEIVGGFFGMGDGVVLVVAVGSIYVIDFAINAVMSTSRSLVVDSLSVGQQQRGSAWAARMGAAGSVVGYAVGSVDLMQFGGLFGWVGAGDQFQCMIVVALLGLWVCVGVTCWAVGERVLIRSTGRGQDESVWSVLPTLWRRTVHLPPRIKAICWAQFWGWIGWFPFLFYSSTWVGETYYRYDHPTTGTTPEEEHDALGNIGRLGSVALVIFSIITFASSVVLPYLISSPEGESVEEEKFTRRPPPALRGMLTKIAKVQQPDLVTAWMFSNLAFAFIMVWAPFVRSLQSATTLVALSGIPWAVSCWAPFAELGQEITKMGGGGGPGGGNHALIPSYTAVRGSIDAAELEELDAEEAARARRMLSDGVLHLVHGPDDHPAEEAGGSGELSGVYLGVLNVYTTLPQFVGTFISWIVFSILEPAKKEEEGQGGDRNGWLSAKKDGPNAIAVCLFIGAVCAVVSAEATRRLKRMGG